MITEIPEENPATVEPPLINSVKTEEVDDVKAIKKTMTDEEESK